MNAGRRKRKTKGAAGIPMAGWSFLRGPGGRALAAVAIVGALVGGAVYGWRRWGLEITDRPEYRLEAENIEITPPPPWIRAEKLKAEVVRDGHLGGRSILDRQLTIDVAEAFTRHGWVKAVTRVTKRPPARVAVEIVYRKPVAMVEVVIDGQPGLLPVDGEGVLLPPEDFAPEQARAFPRISVAGATPTGAVGTPWGDRRIAGAARIAAVLLEHWPRLGLYRIALHRTADSGTPAGEPTYDLVTRSGARVIWGRAPRPDDVQRPGAIDKVARLLAYVETNGSLESMEKTTELDLRPPTAVTPRAATPVTGIAP